LWENEFLADSIDFSKLNDPTLRDAQTLRQYLEYYGYTAGKSTKDLNDALVKFQAHWGLEADGILGPVTQQHIFQPRSGNSDFNDDIQPRLLDKLKKGKYKLNYTITDVDEDLVDVKQRDLGLSKLQRVLELAFKAWTDPIGAKIGHAISFSYVEPDHHDLSNIDLEISWQLFDGVGGTLGCATSKDGLVGCAIQLDRAERWTLENNSKYSIQPVVTHELGHLLGLHHENNEKTVMFPYYRPQVLAPAAGDIDAVVAKLRAH